MRLRHAAVVTAQLADGRNQLERLGLRDPFRDKLVGEHGLDNAVYTVGDTFVEVVAPVRDDTPGGRYLARRGGQGLVGYMTIIEVDDIDAARARAEKMGIRSVLTLDWDDSRSTHLDPRPLGALLSFEQPPTKSAWRWAGPDWEARAVPGTLRAVELGVPDPQVWSDLLDRPIECDVLRFDDATELRFVEGDGLMVIDVEVDGTRHKIGSELGA